MNKYKCKNCDCRFEESNPSKCKFCGMECIELDKDADELVQEIKELLG